MSIYPVKLNEWYPFGDKCYEPVKMAVDYSRCLACDGKLKYSKAYGHHSIAVGPGGIWCSLKCLDSGKIAKVDKRRLRSWKRRMGKKDWLITLTKGIAK